MRKGRLWQVLLAGVGLLLAISATSCYPGTPTYEPPATPTPGLTVPAPEPSLMPGPTPSVMPQPQPSPTLDLGRTLRIGWLHSPGDLSPLSDTPSDTDMVLDLIFDHLISVQLDSTYRPSLAMNWSSDDDGRLWTFTLQPDAAFHDGRRVTPEDVALTLALLRNNPRFELYSGSRAKVIRAESNGPNGLVLELSEAVANIEAYLYWVPVLPQHLWSDWELTGSAAPDTSRLVGSGPFVLEDLRPGEVVLRANNKYWAGAPKIDAVVFHSYLTPLALADALEGDAVDLITSVPLSRLARLRADSSLQVVSGPQARVSHLLINVSQGPDSTGHRALLDPQVRLAIAHAVDNQQLIDVSLQGQAMPGLSVLPPVLTTWFESEIEDVAFDLQQANDVLHDAGYVDLDGDQVREMPSGEASLRFRLFVPSDTEPGGRTVELLSGWLRQIGVELQPQSLIPETLASLACPVCDFDLILDSVQGGPDPAMLLGQLSTDQIALGRNATGYSNPEFDSLFAQQSTLLNHMARRLAIGQLQRLVFDDRPTIVLYYELALQAFRKDRFANWLFMPNGTLSLANRQSLMQVEAVP